MTTVLNRDSIKVKRDLQKRVENWVAEYCDALEVDLWNKVERYIGMPLARLEYSKNRPHALTAFK